jgi:signal transduction histidine kinase
MIEEAREEAVGIAEDVHGYSHRLHPARLEYLGIAKAAATLCREIASQHDVEVSFNAEGAPEGASKPVSMCLYRVLQEALQNAVKHSGARKIDISLRGGGDQIELTVQDFGVGFDAAAVDGLGLGLTSMKERLTALDGQLAIVSAPQHGTTVRARVPLAQN